MPLDAEPNVLAVGDFMFDIIVRLGGPIRHGTDTRAVISRKPGGSASNLAAWLATTGIRVTLAVAVGDDDFDEITGHMHVHGLSPRLQSISAMNTGTLVSLVDMTGERSFLSDRGANDLLDVTPLIDGLLEHTGFLYVSGYAATALVSRRSVADLMAVAREAQIPICLDVGSASFVEEVGVAEFLQWAAPCSMLIANNDEAAVLAGSTPPEEQFALFSEIAETIVIKSGAKGVSAMERQSGNVLSCPAPNINPIDTTGAGDAFLAGFLAERFRGHDLAGQLAGGTRLAARALMTEGGFPEIT